MLSPEAELNALVEAIAEDSEIGSATHLSKREVRHIVATAIRAVLCITQGSDIPIESDAIRLALTDLEHSRTLVSSGI